MGPGFEPHGSRPQPIAQAYANFVQLREKLEDPAYADWWLHDTRAVEPLRLPIRVAWIVNKALVGGGTRNDSR